MERKVIKVGIADLNLVKEPDLIRTAGLGSCVGVVLYDDMRKIGGLAHIMLPDSNLSKQANLNKHKYADTAIDLLLDMLLKEGARQHTVKAKIAGGAQMFKFNTKSDLMRIGPRNIEAVKNRLLKHSIKLISSDVGGSSGRTIEFDPITSQLYVRTVSKGETYI